MKTQIYDALLYDFKTGLDEVIILNLAPLPRLQATLPHIREQLDKLRTTMLENGFTNEQEEIHFFKQIKPALYSHMIFETEHFNLLMNLPAGTVQTISRYYEDELKIIGRFFQANAFHYQYYKFRVDELDRQYFLRAVKTTIPIPEVLNLDPEFSTGLDYLFARFIALEQLQQEIIDRMKGLDGSLMQVEPKPVKPSPELKWTGDKVNLVEIIYGLYFTGQLNNGNADISVIIRFMEKYLQIDLSRAYRDFIDIRNRKTTSPTRYIEQMMESIHKRVDDDLTLKKIAKNTFKSVT